MLVTACSYKAATQRRDAVAVRQVFHIQMAMSHIANLTAHPFHPPVGEVFAPRTSAGLACDTPGRQSRIYHMLLTPSRPHRNTSIFTRHPEPD